jgi:hypothetical protein
MAVLEIILADLFKEVRASLCQNDLNRVRDANVLGTSAAVDLFLVVFPCLIVYGLNMSRNRKIALCFLFSFGVM